MNVSVQHATVIISAYNEEKTISTIITQIRQCSEVDEIIVINDGSTDSTLLAIKPFSTIDQIRIVNFITNKGKGYAMAEGILYAKNEILVFIDADLLNFQERYINQLLHPLKTKKARMVIGQPTNNFFDFRMNPFISIAGERAVFRRDILPLVPRMYESRFGVETLINLYFKAQKMKTIYVSLKGLKHPIKVQKYTCRKSITEYSNAAIHIFKTVILNYQLIGVVIKNTF